MHLFTERLSLVSENDKDADISLVGFPFDSTETNLPGQRLGPNRVREAFLTQETGDLTTRIYDAGNIICIPGNASESLTRLKDTANELKGKLVMLGGEHLGSLATAKALKERHGELQVISLDAHLDLKDEWQGERLAHCTVMRRIHELGCALKIHGAREWSEDEKKYADKKGIDDKIEELDFSKPTYVTVDLDWFDPSVCPGVGDPVPGGYSLKDFEEMLKVLKKFENIVGIDVVEANPMIETNVTCSLAARVLLTLLS